MAELLITGTGANQLLRFPLPEGKVVRLGRSPRHGWAVPWDRHISREHADIEWSGGVLTVRRLDTARNSIHFRNEVCEVFQVLIGERFQIGDTSFELVHGDPAGEISYGKGELDSVGFSDPDRQLQLLSRLPKLIAESETDADFATALVELLLEALPRASGAAVLIYDQPEDSASEEPRMMEADTRHGLTHFQPSRRLISDSLERGKSVLHFWDDSDSGASRYTIDSNLDWAFCTPVRFESCRGWCLYVTGRSTRQQGRESLRSRHLEGDLRFAELLAQFIGAVHQVRMLEQRQGELSHFFPPAVVEALFDDSKVRLAPREGEFTVLFCDVRGFSRRAERSRHNLLDLLNRVSHALSVMTRNIMKYEGVIADFQGDAALAFWGWPATLDEGPLPACRAALAMYEQFRAANQQPDHPLAGFEVGIGIGHGRAVAGQIGTAEQAKVGVFGPVVNLAARLEGMTRQFRVPILLDEATARFVNESFDPSEGRCRRLGRVQPVGMDTVLTVSQLLPPAGREGSLSDSHVTQHQAGVDALIKGDWNRAMQLFDSLVAHDLATLLPMIFMAGHGYAPPDDWNGTIVLDSK